MLKCSFLPSRSRRSLSHASRGDPGAPPTPLGAGYKEEEKADAAMPLALLTPPEAAAAAARFMLEFELDPA